MNDNFRQGVAALKAGDRAAARRLLGTAVRQSPEDLQAWLWLSGAVDRDEERIYCLRQVLQLDPGNQVAARGLAQITERWVNPKPAEPQQQPKPPQPLQAHDAYNEPQAEPSPALTRQLDAQIETSLPLASSATLSSSAPLSSSATLSSSAPLSSSDPLTSSDPLSSSGPFAAEVAPETGVSPYRYLPDNHPNRRFSVQPAADLSGQQIFKTRPSLAQALIAFWSMFLIVWIMNGLLQESAQLELSLSLMTCGITGSLVIYLLVILSLTRYELTTRALSIGTPGKRTIIPIYHILDVTSQQSRLQKILGTADIVVEASVAGELRQMRLHNLSDHKKYLEPLAAVVQEQV
jgi:hypothetical protein